jgi:hypothetical protein
MREPATPVFWHASARFLGRSCRVQISRTTSECLENGKWQMPDAHGRALVCLHRIAIDVLALALLKERFVENWQPSCCFFRFEVNWPSLRRAKVARQQITKDEI